jgi:hypothetical protein
MPVSLILLAIIALTLHILFAYFIGPLSSPEHPTPAARAMIAALVIVLILLLWFVLPLRIG